MSTELQEYKCTPVKDVQMNGKLDNISNLRGVKVTYSNGSIIPTSMAAHLTDQQIYDYFAIGKLFNIGTVSDNMQQVVKVEIFR